MSLMEEAAPLYMEKYTEPGGAVIWADDIDDFYEAFYNWGLFYSMGADEALLDMALQAWNANAAAAAATYCAVGTWDVTAVADFSTLLYNLANFDEDLTALQRAIRRGDGDTLEELFKRTRDIRRGVIDAKQA